MAIIWIDDDTDIIDPVMRPIEQAGYKIERMRTFEEALRFAEKIRDSELVIIDMIIPPGNIAEDLGNYAGAKLVCELQNKGISTPIIVFSVVNDNKIKEILTNCKIAKYVRKPVLPSDLSKAVFEVLEDKENTDTEPKTSSVSMSEK